MTTYTKRFKQAKEIFEQSLGKNWIEESVKHTSDYAAAADADVEKELIKNGSEQLASFVFMKNSEQRKYGKLLSNLKEQYC